MELDISGKKALITGASKGIGKATAEALASEGCELILVSRTEKDLVGLKSSINQKTSTKVSIEPLDLSISGTADQLANAYPDIDILVNNAGAIPGGSLEVIDEEKWRAAWDLKVFGYINMCRSFYKNMKLHNSGPIINIIGNAGDTRDPSYICGVAANASLTAFSQSLGSTSAKDGIRVLAINPGPIATDRMKMLMRHKLDQAGEANRDDEKLFSQLPFGRAGKPQEVSAAVCFLASEKSGYSSGSAMTIDAGLSVRGSFG